jgi:hypothetical protein
VKPIGARTIRAARSRPLVAVVVCLSMQGSAIPGTARGSDPRAPTSPSAVTWPEASDTSDAIALEPRGKSVPIGHGDDSIGEQPEASEPVPRPQPLAQEQLTVAVGLSPEAPGSRQERELLDRLAASTQASTRPPTHVRRLRPGAGDARRICRERRDDLVIMIGYLPEREEPVVLAHDCRLDTPLNVRGIGAIDEPGLVGALRDEHDELVRQGVKERRRLMRIGPRARAGIIGGVAGVVVAVAVGLLVANALRDERVVITVRP